MTVLSFQESGHTFITVDGERFGPMSDADASQAVLKANGVGRDLMDSFIDRATHFYQESQSA